MQEYEIQIEYIKGKENAADSLSRLIINGIENEDIVLDKNLVKEILDEYHIRFGHGSVGNMVYNIKSKYNWTGMMKDIREYVEKCLICKKSGYEMINNKYNPIHTLEINDLWEVDLIGMLPTTDAGNKFIVSIIDHFSKFAFTFPIANKTQENITRYLEQAVDVLGCPKRILSDNGLEFKNDLIINWSGKKGIMWIFGHPYYPQGQELVERFNRTIVDKLRKLNNYTNDNWDLRLYETTLAYNISFNRAICSSPYELVYLKRFIFDIDIKNNINDQALEQDSLVKRINKKRVQYDKEFNKGRSNKFEEMQPGHTVLYYESSKTESKLENKWEENYTILESMGDSAYKILSPRNKSL